MTCVVVVKDDKRTIIGSDSFAYAGDIKNHIKTQKLGKINNQILYGSSGNIRYLNILKNNFKVVKYVSGDEEHYIANKFIPKLKDTLESHGMMKLSENMEDIENEIIICLNNRIFIIQECFAFYEPCDNFFSIGSASITAFGALHAYKDFELDLKDKLLRVLKISSNTSLYSTPPYHILSLEEDTIV